MLAWRPCLACGAGAVSLLSLAAARSALGSELLWTTVPGQTGFGTTYSVLQGGATPQDTEVADDFQVAGTVERVVAKGWNCSIGCSPAPVQGAWVRFYEWTAAGPGALQAEHFLPAGHPGLILLPPSDPATLDITLDDPFVAGGWHFVSVQVAYGEGITAWRFRRSNQDVPVNAPVYLKDDLDGGQWQPDDFFGTPLNSDASFELWGIPGAALPLIEGLSHPALERSGRLLVSGAFFGGTQGEGRLLVGGFEAIVTQWSTNLIIGYVPEQAPLGEVDVHVETAAGASAPLPLTVLPRQQVGRVRWRFAVDADYMLHRPGLGPDGTIYANDVEGRLYALAPDGGLLWIADTLQGQQGNGSEGPVVVGADGTIYVAANPLGPAVQLVAFNPDGSVRWALTDPDALTMAAGPAIGPDGNVYTVFHDSDFDSLGVVALAPGGELLWNNNGSPPLYEHGGSGAELAFGASVQGGPTDQLVFTVDREIDRRVYAFALEDGRQRFAVPAGLTESVMLQPQLQAACGAGGPVLLGEFLANGPGWGVQAFSPDDGGRLWRFDPGIVNELSAPSVGPDGRIYVTWNILRISALSTAGSPVWEYVDDGLLLGRPSISPGGDLILVASGTEFGMPGSFTAIDAAEGTALWEVALPFENGNVWPAAAALFTADGSTAYFPASILADPEQNQYCYLYALDSSGPAVPGDVTGDGAVNVLDLLAVLAGWGPCPPPPASCPADLDGSGAVDIVDLLEVLANWD